MMGRKKDDKRARIPKRIAGVKLPKGLRRTGEALLDKAASAEGRAALAKGLTVAATLANIANERGRAAAPQPAKAEPVAAAPANDAAPCPPAAPLDPVKVAEAVSTVANEVLGRLFARR